MPKKTLTKNHDLGTLKQIEIFKQFRFCVVTLALTDSISDGVLILRFNSS